MYIIFHWRTTHQTYHLAGVILGFPIALLSMKKCSLSVGRKGNHVLYRSSRAAHHLYLQHILDVILVFLFLATEIIFFPPNNTMRITVTMRVQNMLIRER